MFVLVFSHQSMYIVVGITLNRTCITLLLLNINFMNHKDRILISHVLFGCDDQNCVNEHVSQYNIMKISVCERITSFIWLDLTNLDYVYYNGIPCFQRKLQIRSLGNYSCKFVSHKEISKFSIVDLSVC